MCSSSTKSKIRTIKTIVSTIGAVTTTVMVVRSVAKDYLPPEFRDYIYLGLKSFINKFSTHLAIVIYESDDFKPNEIYKAAEQYISTKMSLEANRLKVTKTPNQEHHIQVSADEKLEFTDTYNEVKLYWSSRSKKNMISTKNNEKGKNHHSSQTEIRFLELTFHQEHKDLVLNDYLPSILKQAELKKREEEIVKIFTVNPHMAYKNKPWLPVDLGHPSTFATLAMDTDIKEKVMKDVERFVARRDYYRKVGNPWKRGYLLYGPPGSGKSSLIAAMANYLNFDIYDLDLSTIKFNATLRSLLVAMENRSILVVEDID